MSKPVRMCIVCKERCLKAELIRLQCKNGALSLYSGNGRSFYICTSCLNKNNKKLLKSLSHKCKTNNKEQIEEFLKEKVVNG